MGTQIDTTNHIEISEVDLVLLVKTAFDLSVPQGMGFLQAADEPLTDDEANEILASFKNDKFDAVSMDYVKGRAVKFHVIRSGDQLFIADTWYDHTDEQLKQLLITCGVIEG